MGRIVLTDKFCAGSKYAKGGKNEWSDEQGRGLLFRVLPSGLKEFSYRYPSRRDGTRQRLPLGHYPATGLAAARGRALEAKAALNAGQDPALGFEAETASGMTVVMLIDSYVEKHARPNMRSHAELERRLHGRHREQAQSEKASVGSTR